MTIFDQHTPSQVTDESTSTKYFWREDTNTLEKIEGHLSYESIGSRQTVRRHRLDRRKDRSTPLEAVSVHTKLTSNYYRDSSSDSSDHISLQDIKAVALTRLYEESLCSPILYELPLVDHMIACTLRFFHWFFVVDENTRPKPMMTIQTNEEAARDARDYAKMVEAHKQLSLVYGAFLLGQDSSGSIHHLNGGKLRYSKTKQDKDFYESLYHCLTLCTELTFEKPESDVIGNEIDRLFRSDTFNINQRKISQKELERKYPHYFRLKGLSDPANIPSPAEYRRIKSKRNCFGSSISKSSPMVERILNTSDVAVDINNIDVECLGIGIIGKPVKEYNLSTLKKYDEREKKEVEEEESHATEEMLSTEKDTISANNTTLSEIESGVSIGNEEITCVYKKPDLTQSI